MLSLQTCAIAQFETGPAVATTGYGYGSTSAAIADFNRDGKLDFAMADFNLQIFLGNGDGTFQVFSNYLVGIGSFSVAAPI